MATFDDGWICKSCWTANREQDVHCYRCKALSPEYRVVTDQPTQRVPRAARGPVLRPAAASVVSVASAIGMALGSLAAAMLRAARSVATAVLAGALAGGRAVLVGARTGASFAAALTVGAVRSTIRAAVALGHGLAGAMRSAGRGTSRLVAAGGSALNHIGSRVARGMQTIGTNVRRLGTH